MHPVEELQWSRSPARNVSTGDAASSLLGPGAPSAPSGPSSGPVPAAAEEEAPEPSKGKNTRRVAAAIPARLASTRLPRKVLLPIAGRPMIEHVYRQVASASGLDRVVVLTDDEEVYHAVMAFGGDCEMTPADCASGTDRIAWAATNWSQEAVINIQGDEPLIDPQAISRLASHLVEHPEDAIVTLAAPAPEDVGSDPNTVKVVCDRKGYALYFSRSPIPYERHPSSQETPRVQGSNPLRQHVGIYGYQTPTLLSLAAYERTPLEQLESLEQLRALENGIRIRVLEVAEAPASVDTQQDLDRVRQYLETKR